MPLPSTNVGSSFFQSASQDRTSQCLRMPKKFGLQALIQMCTCAFIYQPLSAFHVYNFSGGGSLPNDELNLESVPLLWMENEALMAGLHLLRSSVNWKINDLKDSKPTKSLNGVWWLLECLPFRWKIRSDLTKLVRYVQSSGHHPGRS